MNTHKKLLLVGYFPEDSSVYAYATSFVRPLQKLGFEVKTFNYRKKYFRFINKRIVNKQLIRTVRNFKPDVIFCIKAETITAKTIKTIKQVCAPIIINFYPDSPFAIWNGNSTPDLLESLPFYDHFLIWAHEFIPALISGGCKKVSYFPFAFDEEIFDSSSVLRGVPGGTHACGTPGGNNSDVCFVGTWEPDREKWLTALCEKLPGLDLALWGNEWSKKIARDSVLHNKIRGEAIYGARMRKVFTGSKIVLNFVRQQNIQAHNMRTFEVPASNSFLLTQWTHDQANVLFKEGESIACFTTVDDLVQKITYYMAHEEERCAITQKGFMRAQEFTLEKQLALLFGMLDVTNSGGCRARPS